MFHALFCKKFLSALSKKRRPRCHFLHASMKARNGRRAASRVINRSAFPLLTALPMCFTRAAIRLLRANTLSFCHLPRRFSITMEPHCALKAAGHLFKNKGCYHHNANDRFGIMKNLYNIPSEIRSKVSTAQLASEFASFEQLSAIPYNQLIIKH